MLAGKILTDFTNLFSPNNVFKKRLDNFKVFLWLVFKMVETYKSMYPNLNPTLANDHQFMLNKINEIRYYFVAEIKKRELMSKRLRKYFASFDCFDKSLIVLHHLQQLLEHQ